MRRSRGALRLMVSMAFLAGCGEGSAARYTIASFSATLARAAAAMTGQEAPMAETLALNEATTASEAATGHPGFDTGEYPGDDAMRAWRSGGSPYEWTGYYMPSPCHPDQGWAGKREVLTSMGYGLAVLYVGQQTWGRKPGAPHRVPVKVSRRVQVKLGFGKHRRTVTRTLTRTVMRRAPKPPSDASCNADFVTAARGAKEGIDAAARAAAEGFAPGTIVFLDIERMDVLHQKMRDYYMAWVRAMLADGRYRPGIYVHTFNANVVYNDVKGVYTSMGAEGDPPFWVAKSEGFELTKLPHEVGHAFAAVWQGMLDVEQTFNGRRIKLDVNVSSSPSPSAVMGKTPLKLGN
jgi:hypothetical protein